MNEEKKVKGCLNKYCYCTGECLRTEKEQQQYKDFQKQFEEWYEKRTDDRGTPRKD